MNLRFLVSGGLLAATICLVFPFKTLAFPFTDQVASDFNGVSGNLGIYNNTTYNTTNKDVELSPTKISGDYTSTVKDAGSAVTWKKFGWVPYQAYGKELPNSAGQEQQYSNNLNMVNNTLLLHFNETTASNDSALLDNSGQGKTVKLVTNAGDAGNKMITAGKLNNAIQLDGPATNGDYVSIVGNNIIAGTSDFTIESWVKPADTSMTNILAFCLNGFTAPCINSDHFQLYITGGNTVGIWAFGGSVFNVAQSYQPNNWYHVAVTRSSGVWKVYFNGKQIGSSVTNNTSFGTTNSFAIGRADWTSTSQFANAAYDEYAISARSLNATEVLNTYIRGAAQLQFQMRSCATNPCTTEQFIGPNGTSGANDVYSESSNVTNSPPTVVPNVANKQFFQYKAFFSNVTNDASITPQLQSVTGEGSNPTSAIDWSLCSTQSAVVQLNSGQQTAIISLSKPLQDSSKAFVLINSSGGSDVPNGSSHLVAGTINDVNSIKLQRGDGTSIAQVSYTVVECKLNEFTVQRGTFNLSNTIATFTSPALFSAVNPKHSLVLVSTNYGSDANSAVEAGASVIAQIKPDGSAVTISRDGNQTANTIQGFYQVVQFSDASGVTVQSGQVVDNTLQTNSSIGLATAVPDKNSWLFCTSTANTNGLAQITVGCNMTVDVNNNDTAVNVYRAVSGYVNTLQYTVVTFPNNTVTVQRGIYPSNPKCLDNNSLGNPSGCSDLIPVTNTNLDPARAFPDVSVAMTNSGAIGQLFPRNRWLIQLTNTPSIKATFWRGDDATTTSDSSTFDSNTKYWQVVQFPLVSTAMGFGWIGNAPDTNSGGVGYISYNCENLSTYYQTTGGPTDCVSGVANLASNQRWNYGVMLEHGDNCGANCSVSGKAWAGYYDDDTGAMPHNALGWLDFTYNDYKAGAPAFVTGPPIWNENTGELSGWARWLTLGAYGNSQFGQNDWGWVKLRGKFSGPTSGTYGVTYDPTTTKFSPGSWAWNANGTSDGTNPVDGSGLGWVQFDDTITSTTPWLQTVQGDVYAGGTITASQAAPAGKYNATYLIQSNGQISSFSSKAAVNDTNFAPITNATVITAPTNNGTNPQVYRGALGNLHVAELIQQAQQAGTAKTPGSGGCDDTLITNTTGVGLPLAGNVFYCNGNMIINNELDFPDGNSTANNQIATGTVVVNGDLTINANSYYVKSSPIGQITTIANIASVAWIVTGKIIIEPSVVELAGAYIALGDDGATHTTVTFEDSTGRSPLEINGLVLARNFHFGRTYAGNGDPAEKIINDSRIFSNPPPGLVDFSKVLPILQ